MLPSIDDQIRILSRRCERILSEEDLRKKLARSYATGKPLRIKLGMDPTAPDVTLGHAVPLSVVRQFQEWGHKAVIIIGDYTARVGDPTGRNATRKVLSGEEIDANAKTYVAQVGKILLTSPESLEIRYNGEWLGKMGLVDIIKLASRKSVAQILTREDFAKRYAEGIDIRLHEILYPLLQGWDSVMIDADVEMGGSDQLFNNLVGREFQKEEKPDDPLAGQVVIVTPLLVGTDGVKKMSKSLKNYVGVTDAPSGNDSMFGKIMSLPDSLMESYYTLVTDLPLDEMKRQIASDPRNAKVSLARHIVAKLHSTEAADAAVAEWDRVHSQKGAVPDNVPEVAIEAGEHRMAALLVKAGLAASNGEATRKIKEGAVYLDGEKFLDFHAAISITKPAVVKLGKRFAKLVPA
ncbi:tyrosine--tRNA ligase [Humisphaera borealis]|uniref:Tyrosine--tRNA ligase n=1 Tax=Humisphaera borealis TaxID=2807512 RepID=A0A7M2WY18_9BACT|nr:tyrosine--tRNA ligase [Humisphaera borealis]QOV90303.1 tyrosine--tRNA ligase [Humisphaera borealis]